MRHYAIDPAIGQPHLGPLLRTLRERLGVSLNTLAVSAGVDHAHVSRIERRQRAASATTLRALAQALDLDATQTSALLLAGGYVPHPHTRRSLERLLGLTG